MAGNIRNSQLYSASETPIPFGIVVADEEGNIDKWLKVGSGLTITDGVLSATDTVYTLPTASDSIKGGIKVGNNLTMAGEVLSSITTTTEDTTSDLILVGVTSGANSILKRNTNVTVKGGDIKATKFNLGSNASIVFNSTENTIDFVFN